MVVVVVVDVVVAVDVVVFLDAVVDVVVVLDVALVSKFHFLYLPTRDTPVSLAVNYS